MAGLVNFLFGSNNAPATPDPYQVSAAQTQSNEATARLQAELNRVNMNTPWGGLNYTQNKDNPDQWTANLTLSPDQQRLLDANTQSQLAMATAGNNMLSRVTDAYKDPLSTASLPSRTTSLQAPTLQGSLPQSSPLQTSVNMQGVPGMQTASASGLPDIKVADNSGLPSWITNVAPGQIQKSLSSDGLPQLTNDYSADRTKVENALYSRINPQLQNDRLALENRLANQGITQGSEAWNNAMRLSDQAANDARMQAILAGGQEQSRLADLTMQTRGQLFGERTTQGNFANNAQNQEFTQGLANANLNNNVRQAGVSESIGLADQSNRARQSGVDQSIALANQANSARGQTFAEQLANAQLANAAAGQQFNQNLSAAGFGNTAAQQGFQNSVTAGDFQNNQRSAQLAEMLQLRNQPLNELNALRTGSQVTAPNQYFTNTPQTQVAPTNLSQNVYSSYQGQQNAYNTQTQQQNSFMNGLANLGSAWMMMPSERRLKRNIQRIGTHSLGIGLYAYQYNWSDVPYVGVMADEVVQVMPEALVDFGGMFGVNYGMIGA